MGEKDTESVCLLDRTHQSQTLQKHLSKRLNCALENLSNVHCLWIVVHKHVLKTSPDVCDWAKRLCLIQCKIFYKFLNFTTICWIKPHATLVIFITELVWDTKQVALSYSSHCYSLNSHICSPDTCENII